MFMTRHISFTTNSYKLTSLHFKRAIFLLILLDTIGKVHKTMCVCRKDLVYVICVCLHIVVSNTYCTMLHLFDDL